MPLVDLVFDKFDSKGFDEHFEVLSSGPELRLRFKPTNTTYAIDRIEKGIYLSYQLGNDINTYTHRTAKEFFYWDRDFPHLSLLEAIEKPQMKNYGLVESFETFKKEILPRFDGLTEDFVVAIAPHNVAETGPDHKWHKHGPWHGKKDGPWEEEEVWGWHVNFLLPE